MPSSPSRHEPTQEPAGAASQIANPKHRELFLEPHYTVELPPLQDGDDGDGDFEQVTMRRHTPNPRRG
jgi:hypothetical protein